MSQRDGKVVRTDAGSMDHGYQVLGPDQYRLHFLINDGAVTRCGGFLSDELQQAIEPAGSPNINVCTTCAMDEAREWFLNNGQSQ